MTDSNKIQLIRDQLDETTAIMQKNVAQVIDRGEKIDLLVVKSEDLDKNSMQFVKRSTQLRNMFCFKNCKAISCIIVAVLIIILLLLWAICGNGRCS